MDSFVFLAEITVRDPLTSTVTLRLSSAKRDPRGVIINGQEWLPAIIAEPSFDFSFVGSDGLPDLQADYGSIGLRFAADLSNDVWSRYQFDGAAITLWVGRLGDAFASFSKVFTGKCGALERSDAGTGSLPLRGNDADLDVPLLSATYAGAGGAEGTSSLKGVLKPWCSGRVENIEPVKLDQTYEVYQVHGYGAVLGIDAVYENALSLGAAQSNAASYAALIALPLSEGQWATCTAAGMFRLGAQPIGKITCDAQGALDGATYVSRPAAVARHLLSQATGVTSDATTAATVDAAFPHGWGTYETSQITIGEVARKAMRDAGGYLFPDASGTWKFGLWLNTATSVALKSDRTATPLVRDYSQNASDGPAWQVKVGGRRCYSIHSAAEISPALLDALTDLEAQIAATDAIGLDGVLSAVEKQDAIRLWNDIQAEYSVLDTRASALGITTERTAYQTERAALGAYLAGLSPAWNDTSQGTTIDREDWNDEWSDYYFARTSLQTKIDEVSATRATWPNISGDSSSVNFSGSVGGVSAATIAATAGNFNNRNDRLATAITAPVVASDGTAVDHTLNTDGSANLSFEWAWSGTEADIDGFFVTYRSDTASTPYVIGTPSVEEQVLSIPADRRGVTIGSVAANRYYTFGVTAYRIVDRDINASGVIKSTTVQPSLSAENPYRPSANVAFSGDVSGTVSGNVTGTVAGVSAATLTATASGAAADAQAGVTLVADITDNSKLGKGSEKKLLVDYMADAAIDVPKYVAQCTALSLSTEATALTNAYNSLTSYLSGLSPAWNNVSSTTGINRSVFRSYFDAYTTALANAANALDAKAATLAQWQTVTGTGKPSDHAGMVSPILNIANCVVQGNSVTKVSGSNDWTGNFFVQERFYNSCALQFKALDATGQWMLGLNDNPENSGYQRLKYAWYGAGGQMYIYEDNGSGTAIYAAGPISSFDANTMLGIVYDGVHVRYYLHGVVQREVAAVGGQYLYADGCIWSVGTTLRQIMVTPGFTNNYSWVGGSGRPENGATVGAIIGSNTYDSGGTLVPGTNLYNSAISVNSSSGVISGIGAGNNLPVYNGAIYVDGAGYINGTGGGAYVSNDVIGLGVESNGYQVRLTKRTGVSDLVTPYARAGYNTLRANGASIGEAHLLNEQQTWSQVNNDNGARPIDYATRDVQLYNYQYTTVTGNSVQKTIGSADWTGSAYSNNYYEGGCSLSAKCFTPGYSTMMGLCDQITTVSYTDIDYAIYIAGTGYYIYESGASIGYYTGGVSASTQLSVHYDGVNVIYSVNGQTMRTVYAGPDRRFFAKFAMYENGSGFDQIVFEKSTNSRPMDGKQNPSNLMAGIRSSQDQFALSDTDQDGVSYAYANVAATTWYTDFNTISYPSASYAYYPYGSTWFWWREHANLADGGSGSHYNSASTLAGALGTNKVYLGGFTIRSSGGSTGGGGSGGGSWCVDASAWVAMADGSEKRARDVRAGDLILVLTLDGTGFEPCEVESNEVGKNDCVMLGMESGAKVAVSVNTPLTVRNHPADAPLPTAANAWMYRLPVMNDDGSVSWESVPGFRYASRRTVAKIRCHQRTYGASSKKGGRKVFTHNPKP